MNPASLLRRAYARLYSAELTTAAWIDTRPVGRMFMLCWYHQGLSPRVLAAMTVPAMVLGGLSRTVFVIFASVAVSATLFARVAVKSHYILNEEDRPCPYCPVPGDRGNGGLWFDWDGGDIPPAPAPMSELDDDRIRAMAGDLDALLIRILADGPTPIPGRHVPSFPSA